MEVIILERKHSIDLLRVLSAVAVIIIHIVSAPITNNNTEIDIYIINSLNTIHTLMNWAVPVFFMITGYCLFQKTEITYRYCFDHVAKYIGVLFTVGFAYALMELIFSAKTINAWIIVESIKNVIRGNIWDHMWFVYEIIGIYLVMPVIHNFIQKGKKHGIILTTLLFVFNIFLPTIEQYVSIGIDIPFGGYLFYVSLGAILSKINFTPKWRAWACLIGLLSCLCVLFFANTTQFGYKHLVISIMAMSVFVIISQIKINPNKLLTCIAKCTWGIYLIHPFFINIAIKLIKFDMLTSHVYIKLFLFAMVVMFLSLFTTYVLRKIPFIKKLF